MDMINFKNVFGPDLRQVYQDTMHESWKRDYGKGVESVALDKWEPQSDVTPIYTQGTKLAVVNEDCLVVAEDILKEGLNPAVLNMASAFRPGGGVINGARAQEEVIFRRTNLFQSLYRYDRQHSKMFSVEFEKQYYPMDENHGGIYSSGVTVFKDKNYAMMDMPLKMSFISVAALNISRAQRTGERQLMKDGQLTEEAIDITKNKIRTIYRIGISQHHDSLVLGAWGCGAFGNPPVQMANLFMDVLKESEFQGMFRDIRFAIIEDHNSKGRNYESFKRVII